MISKFFRMFKPKGLNRNYLQGDVIKALSGPQLQRGFKKRDMLIKNLKSSKFRAKAKLKDYKSVL